MNGVSAVIPVYNGAAYVGRAIDSALAQTAPPDEVVVVDDGSTDGTPELLRSYGGRIRAVRTENAGVGAARNRGLREARGDYAAFLDADDEWAPEKLAVFQDAARRHPEAVLFFSDATLISADGAAQRLLRRAPPDGPFYETLLRTNYVTTSSAMVRRDAAAAAGYFREDFACRAGVEDWEFFLRLVRRGPSVYVPGALTRYRRHPASAIQTKRAQLRDDALRVLSLNEDAPAPALRDARAYVFFESGVRHFAALDFPSARRDMSRCLAAPRFLVRGLALIAASFLGRELISKAMAFRRARRAVDATAGGVEQVFYAEGSRAAAREMK